MYQRHILGKIGENIAIKYLENNGYKIVDKNFECRQGEIDIIAKEKNELVIIEVKTRKSLEYGNPVDAVDKNKRKHIYKVAEYYLYIKKLENMYVRFDVIEIYVKNKKAYINHIKNIIN